MIALGDVERGVVGNRGVVARASNRIARLCLPATQVGSPRIVPLFVAPSEDELTRVAPLPSFAFQSPTSGAPEVTVTVIVSQLEAVPSDTQTSKVAVPTCPAVGVQVKLPPLVIEAPAGTEPPLPLASEKVRVVPGSGSLAVAVKASWVPTWADLLPIGFRVGGVFPGATPANAAISEAVSAVL